MTPPSSMDAQFEALQQKLVPLWRSIDHFSQDPQTIVVVPSISLESTIQGARQQAYEERFLFLLLLLRQPRARLIYVTSQAIHPDVVDYYLDLLPGVISVHAKKRLFLVSPLDGSARPLTQKLLERPQLLRYIRSLIVDASRAHLVPFNTTTLERDLAVQLGIPMYGADPRYFAFTHEHLFDLAVRHGLQVDQARQKGVVFHMMNAIAELGLVGLTAVGNTHEEADTLYAKTVAALDSEAHASLAD